MAPMVARTMRAEVAQLDRLRDTLEGQTPVKVG
jgi:hypothetical protein